jgi:hypothetical protein
LEFAESSNGQLAILFVSYEFYLRSGARLSRFSRPGRSLKMDRRMERRIRRQRMAGFVAAVGIATIALLAVLGLL